jgi:hypothetical protein
MLSQDRIYEQMIDRLSAKFRTKKIQAEKKEEARLWAPDPDNLPQQQAYASKADVLGYGGAAGCGKSDLELGLAVNEHEKTVIFRREATQIRDMITRSRDIIGVNGHLNENIGVWRDVLGHRAIEFAGVKQKDDWRKQQGRARDLYCFDEATEFTEEQFRALITWNRTAIPGQRCRLLDWFIARQDADGRWVIRYWAPWLDPHHPKPAKPGEIRWYANVDGKEIERPDGEPFTHKTPGGKVELIEPLSRTFIPGRVTDNKYLMATNYVARLQSLPEPMRSQYLYGDFSAGIQDDAYQLIPTTWVQAAQNRWREAGGDDFEPEVLLTSVGVDVARGGGDQTILARRFGRFFPSLRKVPGTQTPDGKSVLTLLQQETVDDVDFYVNIDVIGVGSSAYDSCKEAVEELSVDGDSSEVSWKVGGVNNSSKAPKWAKDRSEKFKFKNMRAWHYWLLREALDPEKGDNLMLPDDPEVRADLISPRYKVTPGGIQVEAKDEIQGRLGRSPDCGDAVVLAHAPFAGEDEDVWIAV